MLWEVEIRPLGRDGERERVCDEFDLLTHAERGGDLVTAAARGFLLEGDLDRRADAERLADELLVDPLVETGDVRAGRARDRRHALHRAAQAGRDGPGGAERARRGRRCSACRSTAVRTFRRYFGPPELSSADRDVLFRKVLANDAIEQVVVGPLKADHLALGSPYTFQLVTVPLRDLDDAGLVKLSKDGQARADARRDEDDPGALPRPGPRADRRRTRNDRPDVVANTARTRRSRAPSTCTDRRTGETRTLREPAEGDDLRGDADDPRSSSARTTGASASSRTTPASSRSTTSSTSASRSRRTTTRRAIEPYGGANTGLGGVIRDLLGTGLGAKPICNTDVFCFAPPDYAAGAAAAGRAAPAAGDATASSPACATTATAWASPPSTAPSVRRPLPRQPARLLRHRRPDPGRTRRSRQVDAGRPHRRRRRAHRPRRHPRGDVLVSSS